MTESGIGLVLKRAFNKNQLLILNAANKGHTNSMTYLLATLSKEHGIALSTLWLNARLLQRLNLLESMYSRIELTELGFLVLDLLSRDDDYAD